jgi:hypothetical protein
MSIRIAALSGLAVAALTSAAQADVCIWDWTRTTGIGPAGRVTSILASYDTVSHQFSWQVNYSEQIVDGFWLAVSPGANPKGHAGELALIYADFTRAVPAISIYAYNGVNGDSSYRDGQAIDGVQAPDRIASTLSTDPASGLSAVASRQDIGSGRRLSISFDASVVQHHDPLYDSARNDWTGLAFGTGATPQVGIWMHSVVGLNTTYNDQGFLSNWSYRTRGWFDGARFDCVRIPAPGSGVLAALGMVFVSRRRR